MTTTRTPALLCLTLPTAFVAGLCGSLLGGLLGSPLAPPPAPAAGPADDSLPADRTAVPVVVDTGCNGRLDALERALGALEVELRTATDARPARVDLGDVETFLRLENAAARHRVLRARHERARTSVARIAGEAGLDGTARTAVDAVVEQHFRDELRLAQVDRAGLDELGRRGLEDAHRQLRDRVLAALQSAVPESVARAVADQLWQGRAPGMDVRSADSRPVGAGELQLADRRTLTPGAGRKAVQR
jgi:hypothetical protein